MCLPQEIYQRDLSPKRPTRGARIFTKGPQTVSGQRALDYVRLRHGIGDGSDIGRIKRQQAFVAALIKKVKSQGLNPTTLLPLANAATDAMTVDPGLGSADRLLSFALSMKRIDLHNTKFVTVPWRYEGARVAIVEPDADALWASLKANRTVDGKDASGKGSGKSSENGDEKGGHADAPVSGKGITVAVYNGTTVRGSPPRRPTSCAPATSPSRTRPRRAARTTPRPSSSTGRACGSRRRPPHGSSPEPGRPSPARPESRWSWAVPTPRTRRPPPGHRPVPPFRPRSPTRPGRPTTTRVRTCRTADRP